MFSRQIIIASKSSSRVVLLGSRSLHQSSQHHAVTSFAMPAMSPTMTEGTLQEWKLKQGDKFAAGDVLLSIETDKATIDVEAQDDGVMGKIIVENGTSGVQVGSIIALLAEEGDDISNLEVPSSSASASTSAAPSEPTPSPTPSPSPSPSPPAPKPSTSHGHPTHSRPLLPSVLRLLTIHGITDTSSIKPTGFKGGLTKGDVLAFVGEIKDPRGSVKDKHVGHGSPLPGTSKGTAAETPKKPLVEMDPITFRSLIASGLKISPTAPSPPLKPVTFISGFDEIMDAYLPASKRSTAAKSTGSTTVVPPTKKKSGFEEVLGL
ncbi:single hybrid motif-containing protein [Meredithblackwellia eburnea MCA 4105]